MQSSSLSKDSSTKNQFTLATAIISIINFSKTAGRDPKSHIFIGLLLLLWVCSLYFSIVAKNFMPFLG